LRSFQFLGIALIYGPVFATITQTCFRSTFKFKDEKCVGGKMSKNHLTVLMCVNMTGTDKEKTVCYWKITNTTLFQKRKEASR
jgi:hypothetical protein